MSMTSKFIPVLIQLFQSIKLIFDIQIWLLLLLILIIQWNYYETEYHCFYYSFNQ